MTMGTGKSLRTCVQKLADWRPPVVRRFFRRASETEGAQLLEFALSLPVLLVFLIGIVQFAGAFSLKQKMANAAREGARVMVSNILSTSSCTSGYCSVEAAASAVANYMTNAGVDSSCINPAAPTSTTTNTWTYTCQSGISLTINNQYNYTAAGNPETGTQVTVTYPYTWFFSNIIKLLVPNSTLSLPNTLTETAVMQNMSN